MSRRWLLLLCLLLPLSALADVQASLDRDSVHLGETVTLNLRIDGSTSASTPDLSALDNDFEVLGTSTSSSLSIVNGRQSAQWMIGVALRPKHVGDLPIPALTVAGSQTRPLVLHVSPPDPSAGTDNRKDVFIEVSANPQRVYVGQQLLYTVRLFYDINLNNGSLPDPHADGVDLRKLGADDNYDADRNGRRYHVIERRYALIPQRAGTVTIPSIEFQGEAIDPGNPNDPGSFFGSGGLFGNASPVSADSPPLAIEVQAAPADWGSTAWLPARALTLKLEGVPSDGKATVGQPLNLHMSIDATGMPADALPELTLPAIDGATVYPDPSTDTTHDDGQWLDGHRERSFAVFPQRAGTLTIPAVSLSWFDVQTGQKRVATLPAQVLAVAGAANGAAATSAPAVPLASNASPAIAGSVTATPAASAPAASWLPWRGIALGSFGLWLLSVVAFVWWRKRTPSSAPKAAPDSSRALRQAFMEAARGNDRSAQARHLLAWARSERPGLRNLGQLSDALASDVQRAAIERLQQQQYAGASDRTPDDLAAVFAQGFLWRDESGHGGKDSPLPPLYPFKLD
ncbi:BatD family protein [Dyella jejuensis]|uniref:BatD family protein n=1 Tax=Dyella jejuensis TaxID=1432009 RepID=A0ABW8JK71_9GAMM